MWMTRTRVVAMCAVLACASLSAMADDAKKEVTLTGTMACARCSMKEGDHCQNALKVKDGDNTVVYYLVDNKLSTSSHKAVCHEPVDNVTVTGTVEEKDGKKYLTATKIDMPGATTKKAEGKKDDD